LIGEKERRGRQREKKGGIGNDDGDGEEQSKLPRNAEESNNV
jgi:hypothetical protein